MKSAVAIELTEHDAKLMALSRRKDGTVQLDAAVRASFDGIERGEEETAQKAARVAEAAKRAGVRAAGNVVLVTPKQSATVRLVRLPSSDPEEIESMANFEAGKFIPFNVERHIIDYCIVELDDVEGSDVLIGAIDEPVMEGWMAVAEGAGLRPKYSDVSSLALGYAAGHTPMDGFDPGGDSVLVVNVGYVHTDISLLVKGAVVTTRSVIHGIRSLERSLAETFGPDVPVTLEQLQALDLRNPASFRPPGAPEPIERSNSDESMGPDSFELIVGSAEQVYEKCAAVVDGWVQKLATNLMRTYEFALREYSIPSLEHVIYSGEGASLPGMGEILGETFAAEVHPLNPVAKLAKAPKASIDGEHLVAGFTSAYGAALRLMDGGAEEHLNLLPARVFEEALQRERRTHFALTGAMVLFAAVAATTYFLSVKEWRQEQYTRFLTNSEEMETLAADLDDKERRMDIIRTIKTGEAGALTILEALSAYDQIGPATVDGEATGKRITITDFKYTLGQDVQINGNALEVEDIGNLVYYLQSLESGRGPMFSMVDTRNQDTFTLPRRDQTIYRFTIIGDLAERN